MFTEINKNKLRGKTIAFGITGSFCVIDKVLPQMKKFRDNEISLLPVFSETVYNTDTRFYIISDLIDEIKEITGRLPMHNITGAEPIGPKKLCDMMVIAPCTGNTMAKMANGIVDSSVLMAAKATLRNNLPVVIAISSNDALNNNAVNLGRLLCRKNIYFVPFGQDNCYEKPRSMVSDMSLIYDTCLYAAHGEQIQPMLI